MTATNLTGMDRNTGKWLTGVDHIAQSIGDILTTPLGTRVMRRDYGSLGAELIDAPLNRAGALLQIASSAQAVARWEPRITATKITFGGDVANGQGAVTLTGVVNDQPVANGQTTLSIPIAVPALS